MSMSSPSPLSSSSLRSSLSLPSPGQEWERHRLRRIRGRCRAGCRRCWAGSAVRGAGPGPAPPSKGSAADRITRLAKGSMPNRIRHELRSRVLHIIDRCRTGVAAHGVDCGPSPPCEGALPDRHGVASETPSPLIREYIRRLCPSPQDFFHTVSFLPCSRLQLCSHGSVSCKRNFGPGGVEDLPHRGVRQVVH